MNRNTASNNSDLLMEAIRNTKGRFFGLYQTNGYRQNAQLLHEYPKSILIYDRNARQAKRILKRHIAGVTCG